MKYVSKSLFQFVFDSSSLIWIERKSFMSHLRRRHSEVILPEKVAEEVRQPGFPLENFLDRHPEVVIPLSSAEEYRYLEIRGQPGIHDGEAAAMTVALSRQLPLVIDESEKRARGKAENHGIRCLGWEDFIRGVYL